MKKLLALVCVFCMMVSCACASELSFDDVMSMLGSSESSAVSGVTYELPAQGLSLVLPEEYVALYEGADDSVFAILGADRASTMEVLAANDTYMLIFPGNYTHEIDVVVTENDIASFNDLSEALLNQSAELLDSMLADMGVVVEKHDLVDVNGLCYIRTWYYVPAETGNTYVMQIYTVENNKGYVYRMFSYTGVPIAQDMQDALLNVIAGVTYN